MLLTGWSLLQLLVFTGQGSRYSIKQSLKTWLRTISAILVASHNHSCLLLDSCFGLDGWHDWRRLLLRWKQRCASILLRVKCICQDQLFLGSFPPFDAAHYLSKDTTSGWVPWRMLVLQDSVRTWPILSQLLDPKRSFLLERLHEHSLPPFTRISGIPSTLCLSVLHPCERKAC